MVVKERARSEHPQRGRVADAGTEAEEQLAFYLKRAFGTSDSVLVFNDLRLVASDGEVAQIDHLVFHPWGFVLIESKSVTGSVLINEHGEWCRLAGDRKRGMRSPVVQAGMQAAVLRGILNANFGQSRGGNAGTLSAPFDRVPFDVIVAISDKGIIERRCHMPEVYKADIVATRVAELIGTHQQGVSTKPGQALFSNGTMMRIREFLIAQHRPAQRAVEQSETRQTATRKATATPPPPPRPPPPPPKKKKEQTVPRAPLVKQSAYGAATDQQKRCRYCGTGLLHLQYGRFGYYFRCIQCTRNTPIDWTCGGCGKKARIRKDRENFYKECGHCGRSVLFYVNASLQDLEDPTEGESAR